jgi:hypothetical protein
MSRTDAIRAEILNALTWLGASPAELAALKRAGKDRLYEAAATLDADRYLLGYIGSWGDTLTDDDVLAFLRQWNEAEHAEALHAVRRGYGSMKPPAAS